MDLDDDPFFEDDPEVASSALTNERAVSGSQRRRRRRRHARQGWRGLAFRIGALAGSLLLALAAGELLLRAVGPQDNREWGTGHPLWHHGYHADLDHTIRDDHGEFSGHTVHFNSEGLAMAGELPAEDEPCLVFVGDSFTAGLEVPESDRFASRLGKSLGLPVVNLGCGSFSPLLSRIQLEHYLPQLKPAGVVVQLCTNDVDGDFAKHQLAVRDERGRAIAVPQEQPLFGLFARSHVLRTAQRAYRTWRHEKQVRERSGQELDSNPWSPQFNRSLEEWYKLPELRAIESSIVEIADLCRQRKIPLWLICVPDRGAIFKGQTDYFSEYFLRLARQHRIATVDLEPAFRQAEVTELYYRFDGHFTAAGHALVAKTMLPVLAEQFKGGPTTEPATAETASEAEAPGAALSER